MTVEYQMKLEEKLKELQATHEDLKKDLKELIEAVAILRMKGMIQVASVTPEEQELLERLFPEMVNQAKKIGFGNKEVEH